MKLGDKELPKVPDKQPVIRSFKPQAVPTPMGGVQLMIFGLGMDNQVYAWDSKDRCWHYA